MEISEGLRMRLDRMAAELREEFGPLTAGENGCLLEVAEDWAVLVGDHLSRQVLTEQVTVTQESAAESVCPQCQQLGRSKGHRKRRVETRRGAVHVNEPEYYCSRCRRSFFPDDARAGDGS